MACTNACSIGVRRRDERRARATTRDRRRQPTATDARLRSGRFDPLIDRSSPDRDDSGSAKHFIQPTPRCHRRLGWAALIGRREEFEPHRTWTRWGGFACRPTTTTIRPPYGYSVRRGPSTEAPPAAEQNAGSSSCLARAPTFITTWTLTALCRDREGSGSSSDRLVVAADGRGSESVSCRRARAREPNKRFCTSSNTGPRAARTSANGSFEGFEPTADRKTKRRARHRYCSSSGASCGVQERTRGKLVRMIEALPRPQHPGGRARLVRHRQARDAAQLPARRRSRSPSSVTRRDRRPLWRSVADGRFSLQPAAIARRPRRDHAGPCAQSYRRKHRSELAG